MSKKSVIVKGENPVSNPVVRAVPVNVLPDHCIGCARLLNGLCGMAQHAPNADLVNICAANHWRREIEVLPTEE